MAIDGKRIWYDDNATVAKFLLGGIGTGNFSIGSRGQLCDWEIFNRPMVGGKLPYTFFAIRTEDENGTAKCKILESRLHPPFEESHGYSPSDVVGVPRFTNARLAGEVSRAFVELRDDEMPVDIDMTAFSPFIPLDAVNSGIPGAVIRYRVINTSSSSIKVSIAGSLANAVGFCGYARFFSGMMAEGEPQNVYLEEPGMSGLLYSNPSLPYEHLTNGSMSLVTTTKENVTSKPLWLRGVWWDCSHDFWNDFEQDGKLEDPPAPKLVSALQRGQAELAPRIGSICTDFTLHSGEDKEIEFIISWHFPNRPARWEGHIIGDSDNGRVVKNYYTHKFDNAWSVSKYLVRNMDKLEKETDAFREALYKTTLPPVMLDAMASNITVIRSNTCFRIEDGTFLGWEGTFNNDGSCEGNCHHVWNYQQTLAFLFPELERTMRRVNFVMETGEDGEMAYRSNTVFGYERFTKIPPAADGQMGTIIQLYRDWKLSGDDNFLREMWGGAVRALEFAFIKWDQDGDSVFEAEQHNTYDIEFHGVNSMTNSIFYAALKAAEEMATYLGDVERAACYRNRREEGSYRMDELLFNGEYYIQKLEDDGNYQYQYYDGCLSDQVLGQELAHIAGLGYILPEDHVKKAIKSVFNYNFRSDMTNHFNVQRVYATNNDAGLILCTWPRSDKPAIPFVYSDEVWTGIEYQVASHLICEGYFEDALTIVKAVRERYDGIKRNPWNEVECGNHYVRSMASWGLLLAASGFKFDLTKGVISFVPKVSENDFTCFFSTARCWGLFRQNRDPDSNELKRSIEILYGDDKGLVLK